MGGGAVAHPAVTYPSKISGCRDKRRETMRRTSTSFSVVILSALCVTGCQPATPTAPVSPSGPDLLIRSFTILKPKWTGLGGFEATSEVVVQNAGNESASSFEVGIVGVNRESKYVRFNFSYTPTLTAALAPGQEVTLTSKTGLSWHGHFDLTCADDTYDPTQCAMHDKTALWLMAIADYCAGDEVPDHCAVEEIDERNNSRGPVIVEKPGQ
jgi:hypothetical protein